MLCSRSEAFDDDDWLFEIKWDGVRAIAYVEEHGRVAHVRIRGRRGAPIEDRYRDCRDALAQLPSGTILDGEIVAFGDDGLPDFPRVLRRGQAAHFVAFDQLYSDGSPILDQTLRQRRASLAALALAERHPRLIFSDGVEGSGIAYFEQVRARGLEGVVAKHLESVYAPGQRLDTWRKIKVRRTRACVVIGWLGKCDLKSLLVATDFEDGAGLRYVGKVGSGIGDEERQRLVALLEPLERPIPVVDCDEGGRETMRFVEPEIFVEVHYLELSKRGRLRAPTYGRILEA